MRKMIILMVLAAGLAVSLRAETPAVTLSLKITNSCEKEEKAFPLVLSVKKLPKLSSAFNAVKLLSSDKLSQPCQLDDLNSDGKLDKADEISMLVDLKSGDNVFQLIFSETAKEVAALETPEDGRYRYISNDIVKVLAHNSKFHTRVLQIRVSDSWIPMTGNGTYHSDVKLDNQWREWKWGKPELKLISDGPVRKILRDGIDRTNNDSGKKVRLIHDWSVFIGRSEILSVINVVNTSENQVTQITRMTNGFYDITTTGKSSFDHDKFAGISKKGKLVTDFLKNSRYHVKKPKFTKACWYDASYSGTDAPRIGFGSVVVSTSGLFDLLLGYIEKKGRKKLRMTEAYEPKDAVIWPNKSYVYKNWYVLHKGDCKVTKNFCDAVNGVKIKVSK